MEKSANAAGSCLCGAIRFEFDFPSKWCAHCYCAMCRKAHGAGFVTWIGVEAKNFRITAGEQSLVTYQSSAKAVRKFCGQCGSSMFFESEKWPGEVHVALACVDTAVDREAKGNAFTDDKAHWVALQPPG